MQRFESTRAKAFVVYEHVYDIKDGTLITRSGGIQRYLHELVDVLAELNLDVFVLQRGRSAAEGPVVGSSCTVISLPSEKWKRLGRLIPDVISSLGGLPDRDLLVWGSDTIAKRSHFSRSIAIQHGSAIDYTTPPVGILRRVGFKLGLVWVYKLVQRRKALMAFEHARFVVCVDHNFPNWYRTFRSQSWGRGRYTVIPNFAELGEAVDRTWEFSASRPARVLFARRFVEKRGVVPMLAATDSLLSRSLEAVFTFAGAGPLESQVQKLRSKFPQRISVSHYHPDATFRIHAEHDIAVVPTIGSEGTSLSLLEAMAAGCVVIASPVGGITNIVLDEHNGLLVEPTPDALANAVERITSDPVLASRLSKNARATVANAFSFEKWRAAWVAVFSSTLDIQP